MKRKSILLTLLVGALFVFVPSTVLAKEVTVEDENIQAVIDAETTEAGDVIILAEGEYTGNLALTKDVTLKGAGKDKTVIKGQVDINAGATTVAIQDLTISAKSGAGVKLNSTSDVTISNVVIEYDGYTEGDYGNGVNFRGIWLVTDVSDGSTLLVENSEIYAKYAIHLRSAENEVTIKDSEITGFTALDISNGPTTEYGGTTTELAENNVVIIEGSTLTGVTALAGNNNSYGTIVIGGQKNLELLIDNSTVTNEIVAGKESAIDLIRFGHGYLTSENTIIVVTNSELINTDADNGSAVVNFMTEKNTSAESMIIIDDATEVTSANEELIKTFGDNVTLTLSSIEGDVTITVPTETELTKELLAVSEVEGYKFEGWYTDEEYTTEVADGTIITEDTTIYAKFTKVEEQTTTGTTPEIENVDTGDINIALLGTLAIVAIAGLAITSKKLATKVR